RYVGAGCDGRLPRQVISTGRDAESVRRNRVVLAPRPWRLSRRPVVAWQRGQERPFPGEIAYKPSNHSRGESRDVRAVPVKPVCISFSYNRTRFLRVPPAPGFPCALSSNEGQRIGKAQAKIAP